ncbi:Glu-tRNA(Gln) amidotransferase GatDE subunit E [Candidatus Pacearchaeota archaeon]|nr:Glu-tRNA(Gln) amidotransferase GatDE subunit E [Candidatus Pacearchaeota archaeon]
MDYSKVGLKAGLEIHQQLDTGKLFSRTPSLLRTDKADYTIKRKLHAVAGETGEVDVAVEHEASLNKEFVYEGYDDTISLVELDEAPPQEIDSDALEEAIKICLLLNCSLYGVSQVMRKTVIDGSNTSGFQRTVLLAHDGFIETSFGKVGIESVALEEDAARIISREKDKNIYRLDRLGIPLVEITTKPDMKTAEEIKEVALKIGEILRAAKVKRGIGTIRQDVNISTKGHARVEIKGFQDPKIMIKTVDLEIERQQDELKKSRSGKGTRPPTPKPLGEVRNAKKDGTTEFLRPMPGEARMYPETDLELLKIGKDRISKLKRELPRLRGEIRDELKKSGLSEEIVNLVLSEDRVDEFNTLMSVYSGDADLVGKMITLWRTEFSKKYNKDVEDILDEGVLEKVLEALSEGKIDKSDIRGILVRIVEGENVDEALKVDKAGDDEIEEEIRKIVKEKPGLRPNAYMGLVMAKLRKKVDAKKAMEIIKKVVGD